MSLSDQQILTILIMYQDGHRATNIAKAVGCLTEDVRTAVAKAGVRRQACVRKKRPELPSTARIEGYRNVTAKQTPSLRPPRGGPYVVSPQNEERARRWNLQISLNGLDSPE